MAEYIEREVLLSELMKGTIVSDGLYGMGVMAGVDFAMKKIVEQPAADVEPVRHGRWHEKCVAGFDKAFCTVFVCSECAKRYRIPGMNYCPNCRAKMDATDINVGDKEETVEE